MIFILWFLIKYWYMQFLQLISYNNIFEMNNPFNLFVSIHNATVQSKKIK